MKGDCSGTARSESIEANLLPGRNIEDVIKKGQGGQSCCVAFALMNMHRYQGIWGNGSIRFLHCICKMLDGGISGGTTALTGIRALKGWWTCDENLWPTDIDLSTQEFEDWQNIPKEAWQDARQKRVQRNRDLVASWPTETLNFDGRVFRLLTSCTNDILGEDKQFDLTIIDEEIDTVAWVQLRAYVKSKQITLEDLFVKSEFRRLDIGSRLLQRIERISCLDSGFYGLSSEIIVPIPEVDIRLPDRLEVVKEFFRKNGYVWKDAESVMGREYSIFTAVKTLPLELR